MSPEQARGLTDTLDERTDIYALGAILFFLLTGEPPGASRHPRQLNGRLPRPLDAICARAIAERKEDRYTRARALADDIIRFLDGQPVSAYRESIIERIGRFVRKNLFVVVLIVAYLLMRLVIFLSLGN
jgi:serine/threonine protein kinase